MGRGLSECCQCGSVFGAVCRRLVANEIEIKLFMHFVVALEVMGVHDEVPNESKRNRFQRDKATLNVSILHP